MCMHACELRACTHKLNDFNDHKTEPGQEKQWAESEATI